MAEMENQAEVVTEVVDTEIESVSSDKAEAKKNSKKSKKNEAEKPGFFARMKEKLKKFWKNYKSEMKKITWYTRKQTLNSTLLVLACMIIAAVFVGILDFGFSMAIEGLGKLF